MALEISGKVLKKLDVQKGESSRGPWQKGGFVIETESNFPKKICCTVWGDLISQVDNLKEGDKVTASIDIESREYNERWYTDIKAWQIKPMGESTGSDSGSSQSQPGSPSMDSNSVASSDVSNDDASDDLPF